MDHIQLLGKTKIAFINHQTGGNRYRYPDALKNDAVSLLKYYSTQELGHQLSISAKVLSNWRKHFHASPLKSTAFVPLTLAEEPIDISLSLTEPLILKLPQQLELILPKESMKDTAQFICCLIKEISKCSI